MTHEYLIEDFPEEAIRDCSASGNVDDAVEYWIKKLDFRPDSDAARKRLREYGAWDDDDLEDDEANRSRLFWVMMCDFGEWDGTPESPCGSDCSCVGA